MITTIRKRNGEFVPYDNFKIANAIFKAAQTPFITLDWFVRSICRRLQIDKREDGAALVGSAIGKESVLMPELAAM